MRPLIPHSLVLEHVLRPHTIPIQPHLRHYFTQALRPLSSKRSPPPPLSSSTTSQKLSSSRCHIFWDLDNVQPTQIEDISVIAHAIRTALRELVQNSSSNSLGTTLPPPQLTVFANPTTLLKFSPTTADFTTPTTTSLDLGKVVEEILGGSLVLTTGRKQSVDFAMKSAMITYLQEERKKISSYEAELNSVSPLISNQSDDDSAIPLNQIKEEKERETADKVEKTAEEVIVIACVSDDTDYVQVLQYLGNNTNSPTITSTASTTSSSSTAAAAIAECLTVSIGEHKRRKRPAWVTPKKLDSLALPTACDAAITLVRPRKYSGNSMSEGGGGGAAAAEENERWRVETVWINPKRNWKERITE